MSDYEGEENPGYIVVDVTPEELAEAMAKRPEMFRTNDAAYEDQLHLYSASFLDDAARQRPSLDQLEDTLGKVAAIDWAKISADLVTKLGKPARLRRAVETPVKQRTARDAADVALARLIADGTFK